MKLLRIKQVIEITTLSRSTIYRLIAKGEFPKGKNLSSRTVVWDELDIMNWIIVRIRMGNIKSCRI